MAGEKQTVAFIGLGAMGFGMATNLIRSGFQVTGFDVHAPTLSRFKDAGGSACSSPAEAAAGKAFYICMVATAQQAQSALFEGANAACDRLPAHTTLLLCSTVPSSYVQGVQRQLADRGRGDVHLVDCPVSGGAVRAADGTLSIMAAGSEAALGKALPLLGAMADPARLYVVRGGVGAGSNMKMCHQVLAANQILAASEAMGFASRLGLDLAETGEAVKRSEGWSWMFEDRLRRMLDPGPVASAVAIIAKDSSIISSEARRVAFPTPLTSVTEQQYFAALGRGYGQDDDSSLLRLYNEGGGRETLSRGTVDGDERLALVRGMLRGIHLCSAAECLAFAQHLGLDLDQVLDLCVNAAGGSSMLSQEGGRMLRALRRVGEEGDRQGEEVPTQLESIIERLEQAVNEAQLVKAPAFLSNQALNLLRLALRSGPDDRGVVRAASIVRLWG